MADAASSSSNGGPSEIKILVVARGPGAAELTQQLQTYLEVDRQGDVPSQDVPYHLPVDERGQPQSVLLAIALWFGYKVADKLADKLADKIADKLADVVMGFFDQARPEIPLTFERTVAGRQTQVVVGPFQPEALPSRKQLAAQLRPLVSDLEGE